MMQTTRSPGISMYVNNVPLRVSSQLHVFDFIDIDINAKESV